MVEQTNIPKAHPKIVGQTKKTKQKGKSHANKRKR